MSTTTMKEQMQEHAKSLMCCDCNQPGCRKTLATLCVRDWQGTLVCICRDCYNKNPRPLPKIEVSSALSGDGASLGKQRAAKQPEFFMDFAEFQHRSWNLRKKNTKSACRVLGFQKAQAQLEKEANESLRAYRKRLFLAARCLAFALVCSFERMSDTQRKEVEEAMDWWEEQQAAIVRDPSHIPASLAPMALLPDYAAQYLASITDTLSDFFLCRQYDTHVLCLVASARSLASFFSIRGCGERETALSVAVAPCLIRWLHLRKRRRAATFPPRTIGFTRT
jgi:hypothetical protein